jgi:cytochrome c oxidase assembly protein subunit 15
MAMEAFQRIYFWEYLHRLLGRLIGLAFALPLAWFALRRAIPAGFGPRLVALLALGGLQGVVGWWMVASGLVDRVDVAHERLAVHLGLAFLILALLAWTALDLRALARPAPAPATPRPRRWVAPFFALLAAQFTLGAFVAGLRAGTAFDTWPKMGEHWAPPGWLELAPLWRNLIDNPLAVQFAHRSLAYLVAAAALAIAWRLWRAGAGWRAGALAGAVLGQFALGVAVVLTGVPLALGVAHQSGAALLLLATVAAAHWATRPAHQPRRLGAR